MAGCFALVFQERAILFLRVTSKVMWSSTLGTVLHVSANTYLNSSRPRHMLPHEC